MFDASGSRAETRCLADVSPEPVDWLWPRRFARGKLNILAGQPGLGKSQITAWMAATVTQGGIWPDGTRAPVGSFLIASCEDDAADTIVPRLIAAGAVREKVHSLDWLRNDDGSRRTFDVGRDADQVRRVCETISDVVLIIIDPISAYMGSADSHKTSDVRAALAPLQAVAAALGACIVLVSHLNKGGADTAAMSRVTGSGAFVAAARSAWIVGPHPDDGGKRVLAPLKNNIGDDKIGFAYQIEGKTVAGVAGGIETSRVVFDAGGFEVNASRVLKTEVSEFSAPSALTEAEDFLAAQLAEGPLSARDLKQRAEDGGIAWRTIERAKIKLGIVTEKQHGARGAWCWCLPKPTT